MVFNQKKLKYTRIQWWWQRNLENRSNIAVYIHHGSKRFKKSKSDVLSNCCSETMENGKDFWTISELPSGKRLHNELEHHHAFMGKLTISMGIFYVANCKRLPGRVANIQEMHLNDDLNELQVSLWSVAALQFVICQPRMKLNHGLWQLGGYCNRHINPILFYGSLPIKQPLGVFIQDWQIITDQSPTCSVDLFISVQSLPVSLCKSHRTSAGLHQKWRILPKIWRWLVAWSTPV